MNIKTITLIIFSLTFNKLFAQKNIPNNSDGINIECSASSMYKPDIFNIKVSISEFESTDPITQETTKIGIEKIETTIYKKLEDLKFKEIHLNKFYESPSLQNYNYNYTNLQKSFIRKEISFTWNNELKFEALFKKLQLKGVDNILIEAKYSEELQLKINQELSEKAIIKAQNEAKQIAYRLNLELGQISSFSSNSSLTKKSNEFNQSYIPNSGYYPNNNIGEKEFFTTVYLTYKTK